MTGTERAVTKTVYLDIRITGGPQAELERVATAHGRTVSECLRRTRRTAWARVGA